VDRKAIAWLERDHRIAPSTVSDLRAALSRHDHGPVELVPTHGDWQTRNWLVDDGTIRIIDLGHAERPSAQRCGVTWSATAPSRSRGTE
jgi:hypothetical protein